MNAVELASARRASPSDRAAALEHLLALRERRAGTARSRRAGSSGKYCRNSRNSFDGQDQRVGPAFAEVRIADAELGFLAVGALRIGVDELAEVLAGRRASSSWPAARCRGRTGYLSASTCARRSEPWLPGAQPRRKARATTSEGRDADDGIESTNNRHQAVLSDLAAPAHGQPGQPGAFGRQASSSVCGGANPRSARARVVSANVSRMSPFCVACGRISQRPPGQPANEVEDLVDRDAAARRRCYRRRRACRGRPRPGWPRRCRRRR